MRWRSEAAAATCYDGGSEDAARAETEEETAEPKLAPQGRRGLRRQHDVSTCEQCALEVK
eukprot:4597533-Pleurochrysis_carterae.AAC.2